MKRRNFNKLVIAGSALGAVYNPGSAFPAQKTKRNLPNGIDYYNRVLEIWDRASGSELPKIIKAADIAAERLKKGGKIFSNAFTGHMLQGELRNGRAGNPDCIITRGIGNNEKEIGAGDFVLFDTVNPGVKSCHDRGAFCVGLVVPYRKSRAYPKGVHAPQVLEGQGGIEHEDVADIMLDFGLPYTNGVLSYEGIPVGKPCPVSVQGAGNLHWMLSAEIAHRDRTGKGYGKADQALAYLKKIKERGADMRKDNPKYDKIALEMTDLVSKGGAYWSFSGGEGCRMFSENVGRASGLRMVKALSANNVNDLKKTDFVVFGGEHSDVKENIEMAETVKIKGAKVIWIGPSHSEGSTGSDMSLIADWSIDTYSPERNGVIKIYGIEKPVCPTTGILYALGLWMLNANFIARMITGGMVPIVSIGLHMIGGREYSTAVAQRVLELGY